MTRSTRLLIALALVMPCSLSLAHPLHGSAPDLATGLTHPFLGLDHMLVAIAIGIWAAHLGGRALWLVPVSFASAMLAGGVLGLGGWSAPAIEPMIAVSVIALGALVFFRYRSPTAVSATAAAFFALFHGMAHAQDVTPASAGYLLGLLIATAALHLCGIAAARKLPSALPAAGAAMAVLGCWWMAALVI